MIKFIHLNALNTDFEKINIFFKSKILVFVIEKSENFEI